MQSQKTPEIIHRRPLPDTASIQQITRADKPLPTLPLPLTKVNLSWHISSLAPQSSACEGSWEDVMTVSKQKEEVDNASRRSSLMAEPPTAGLMRNRWFQPLMVREEFQRRVRRWKRAHPV